MTIIDFITTAPTWLKIVLGILVFYLATWFPRIIGGISRCLRELRLINKKLDILDTKIAASNENQKRRTTADWLNAIRAYESSNNENKENPNVS